MPRRRTSAIVEADSLRAGLTRRPARGAGEEVSDMTPTFDRSTLRERVAGVLLAVGLLAGPAATHLYWMLGGTWGLHRSVGGQIEQTTTGIRVVAAVVLVLVLAAVLIVLVRAGVWRQTLVPDRVTRMLAWAVAGVFLLEALASFTYSREYEWWLYGPVSLVLGLLALVVAHSGARERQTVHGRPRQEASSH
jgi:uncharacterized protein DUF3995